MSPEIHFVGRKAELGKFRQILASPYGNVRIALILGNGGIGKTQLVRKMLEEAKLSEILAPEEPLDLFATDLRHIDGIQLKIIEAIETLTGLKDEQSPFAEFLEENRDTSEKFHECLEKFCKDNPLVLAFDTFENLDTVASNWLFESGDDGLQVPGLICIIAGRLEKDDLEKHRKNPLAEEIEISGLKLPEADKFYQEISDEFKKKEPLADPLEDFLVATGKRGDDESLEWVLQITNGHPLRLEMAFRWARTFLSEKSLIDLTAEKFEEKLMEGVREFGETGSLDVGPLKVSQPVFDTLVCMAYVTRRFDERFLRFLIDEKLILLGETNVKEENILENLEKYFFVKVRLGNEGEQVLQLHDEMARLVREHVWRFLDQSGEKKQTLFRSVIKFYDQLIERTDDKDAQNVLRVEQLYYVLKSDPLGEGKRLWFSLAELDDDYINSVLPGEIKNYKKDFDLETRYEIHSQIAQIEFDANHLTQARREWMQVQELGEELGEDEKRNGWVAAALFGLANCERDVSKALVSFQEAEKFCEDNARQYLPSVYYNIGFTYRRMQDINKAIDWYRKAQDEFQMHPWDKRLGAKIANDLGYAYSLVGEWAACRENVKEGQEIRQNLLLQLEHEVIHLEGELKSTTNEEANGKLHDQLNRKKAKMSKAIFQLGLSYSTLGEVYRYDNDLDESVRNYGEALRSFKTTINYHWQARTLFSRGETYRRIAQTKYRWVNKTLYQEYMEKAEEDIKESLYLCEKYRIKTERDTANRRMGRVSHDHALYALENGDKPSAQDYLEQARSYFVGGLKYARETNDTLEELSNLTELAFIVDDFMNIMSPENVPQEYYDSLGELNRTLTGHHKDRFRIYQFPVFENLYKLEKAATDYQHEDYEKALEGYLDACVRLASDPGYGRARYKQYFSHLTGQIENLPTAEMRNIWCNAFIKAWVETIITGKPGRTLAQEVRRPDLVVWCREQLNKNEARKA